MTDLAKLLLDAKRHINDVCGVPSTLLLSRKAESTAALIQQATATHRNGLNQKADMIREEFTPMLFHGMKVIVSDMLPKEYITVGHTFRDVPSAKHRSLRLWKKLRFGKRRCYVKPIIEEFDVAFMINEDAMKLVMNQTLEFEDRYFHAPSTFLWRSGVGLRYTLWRKLSGKSPITESDALAIQKAAETAEGR